MSENTNFRLFSLSRVLAIANNTFTQLVRMKIFYFLFIFSVLIVGVGLFVNKVNIYNADQELKILKDVALGGMSIFSSLFAIAATAMLIPKDVEDRTLYTILAKPVPRLDYLMGKYLGVIFVILVSIIGMAILFSGILYWRQQAVMDAQLGPGSNLLSPEDVQRIKDNILSQGLTWNLQNAVIAIFLKAMVIAGFSLVISTVATSSLFTIIIGFAIFFISHAQSMAREYFEATLGNSGFGQILIGIFALIFPDLRLFDIADGVALGEIIPLGLMLKICGIGIAYVFAYTTLAFVIFAKREL